MSKLPDPVNGRRGIAAFVVVGLCAAAGMALAREAGQEAHAGAAAGTPGEPRVAAMVTLGLIMLVTYLAIAFSWVHKAVASIVGALATIVAALVFGVFGETGYDHVHEIIGHDLGVLGVIIGTSILVEVVGLSGLFHWIAIKIVKKTRGDPHRLFVFVCLLTFMFVALLTLAPGTLLVTSLVLVITRQLGYHPKAYLVALCIIANSAALFSFSSGIATLMIGTAADIPYAHFFIGSTPLAFITGGIAYLMLRRAYRDTLDEQAVGDVAAREAAIASYDEWALVKDRSIFVRSGLVLGVTVVGFALAQTLHVGLDFVALAGGAAALLFCGGDVEDAVRKVNWTVILFFSGLFVIVGAVKESGLLGIIASAIISMCGGNLSLTVIVTIAFVMLASGFVDNIPVAATMIPIARSMIEAFGDTSRELLWWGLIAAANLGGNATPIGSSSAIIALHALEREHHEKVKWGEFMRISMLIMGLQFVAVCVYVLGMHHLGWFPSILQEG